MDLRAAQREVSRVYTGGSIGMAVSGIVWLVSAALGEWVSERSAMTTLVAVGFFLYPINLLVMRLLGRRDSLSKENPLNQLAMQAAFIIPLCLPVILGSTLYKTSWFYPAFMVVVGAHYLPFMTLYGIWQYAIAAALLIFAGVGIGMYLPESFTLGGWVGGLILLLFPVVLWRVAASLLGETGLAESTGVVRD